MQYSFGGVILQILVQLQMASAAAITCFLSSEMKISSFRYFTMHRSCASSHISMSSLSSSMCCSRSRLMIRCRMSLCGSFLQCQSRRFWMSLFLVLYVEIRCFCSFMRMVRRSFVSPFVLSMSFLMSGAKRGVWVRVSSSVPLSIAARSFLNSLSVSYFRLPQIPPLSPSP